ncbi:MAG TPA: helix-turn-helix domain-containing protein, partial [Solirubrobacteraceae bacterium]|nr:helix-turn-helix domain-containing protein [Solirubrobacteraceae bacterium]
DRALAAAPVAVGPTVAVADAARSLRWARLALDVAPAGAGTLRAADHLADLILLQDSELAALLVRARLAPLNALAPGERERLTATLAAWLAHQRHTPAIADELHVHPQTVRYRMAKLRRLLGDALDTAEGRFQLGLALRIAAHG